MVQSLVSPLVMLVRVIRVRSISQPIDIVGGTRAATNISGGGVTSFTITNAGVGYSASNPPQILVEVPEACKKLLVLILTSVIKVLSLVMTNNTHLRNT